MAKENIKKKIKSLLSAIQEQTGATDEEINNLQKILNLADYAENKEEFSPII